MDVNRLSQGTLIAAGSAVVLFLVTFLPWLGADGIDSINLWKSTNALDIYILIVTILVVAPAVMAAMGNTNPLPFTGAATTTLLGAITVILVFFFLIDHGDGIDAKIGVFLGLLAAIGVTVGGYMALEDEGARAGV
jgi:hypothetical protein